LLLFSFFSQMIYLPVAVPAKTIAKHVQLVVPANIAIAAEAVEFVAAVTKAEAVAVLEI
jgi:hypothetical protein